MAQCINHPQYEAIEHCEHCRVPLCGMCLWYAESGERLCERCAKQWQAAGHVVYPPEQFADGIQPTLVQPSGMPTQRALYSGNSIDLAGFAAVCLGATVFLSCIPCMNLVTPWLALLVGVTALAQAKHAVNPKRTQLLAWIGIGSGILVALLWLGWLALSFGMPMILLLMESITNP